MRLALRQLFKSPGFTAVAVLTLALGIGANTAVFSIIKGVLLKPLPYPEPDRLVTLWERSPERGVDQDRVSGPNYLDWREQNTVFTDLAASPGWQGSTEFNLMLRDGTTKVIGSYVSSSLFTTLGVRPLLGRPLSAEEDRREGNRAAVLSYELWQRQFNGDSNVIGRTLTVDTYGRRDYAIVGVMPPGFGLPSKCEVWLPMGWMGVRLDERRNAHWHNVIARLKPGVTLQRATAEMNGIQARLRQAHPEVISGSEVAVVPLSEDAVGHNMRSALLVIWGVVAVVLLIACANVANLMLARASARQKEIAVRLALGAGRWRIARQVLGESILLAFFGCEFGVLLAQWGLKLFIAFSPHNIPRLSAVTLDGRVLLFTLGISACTGILFGLAPAWQMSLPNLNDGLKEGTRGASVGTSASRMRNVLVVAELALSLVLLVGAGLMLESFARMLRTDRGFQSEHLLTAQLDFSVSGFSTWVRPTATRPQVRLQQLMERLRSYPGVQAVAAGSSLLRRDNHPPAQSFTIFGRPALNPEDQATSEKAVSPDWLKALGMSLLRGRNLTEGDILETSGVVLVNESFVHRYFPNEDPVGKKIFMGATSPPLGATNVYGSTVWSEIVGVVSDVKSLHPHPEVIPEIYHPYWQWPMQSPTLLVRAAGNPVSLGAAIRREMKQVIPNLPPPAIQTMDEVLSDSVAEPRLQTMLLSLFAGLALILATVGLYGVLAYNVTQRRHEIGIRMALGAQQREVLTLVIAQGMKLAVLGLCIGIGLALAATRVIRGLIYDVTPHDPIVFGAVSLIVLAIALAACFLPAFRASKVDPMVVLRYE